MIPELAKHEGSWVVVRKSTNVAVLETFDRRCAEAINGDRYDVLTVGTYLGRLNAELAR